MNKPLVSVVMSVYNGELYLAQAIDSILAQTFNDFEFIIIDDGSKDGTHKILKSYNDKRLRLHSRANKGLAASLNEGVRLSQGEFIARQDQDDISLPDRLQRQVDYLISHPEIGLLGTQIEIIDGKNQKIPKKIAEVDFLTHPDDLKLAEVFSNQFAHGSVIFRKSTLDNVGLYNQYFVAEDYDLWSRISKKTGVVNLGDTLYKWRLHTQNISTHQDTAAKVQESALKTASREFEYYLGHKSEYKFFTFHPFSMKGGPRSYLLRKSSMYRDMAIMYCRHGLRRWAFPIIMLAILHAPWRKKNYRQFLLILTNQKQASAVEYELF